MGTSMGETMRATSRLTDIAIRAAKAKGLYPDGHGLYLQVAAAGTKSWIYRFKRDGRSRDMGLGPLRDVSLAVARRKAQRCRQQLLDGIHPLEARRTGRAQARLDAAKAMSFDQCRDAYIAAHQSGWHNAKHRQQWTNTLAAYASPVIGKLPVAAIDTGLVVKVLEPIWTTKTETATRVRGRIERILAWATTREYRIGDNPARWRGHLDQLLPTRSKVRKVKHHAALAYAEVPAFMAGLRSHDTVAAAALEFAILTATRAGEALGARWDEIDFNTGVWSIPTDRMKADREHRVPLDDSALAVLRKMSAVRRGDLVFPGVKRDKPLSNMAMAMLLRRMGHGNVTVHGFRSSFRDWAAETTAFPNHVVEMALAHAVGDKVESAYRRGDLFDKRRRLMRDWDRYCTSKPAAVGVVVPLRAG